VLRDLTAASRDFDDAIKLAPNDAQPKLRRASVAIWVKDNAKAKDLAEQALKLDPKAHEAYTVFGVLASRRRDYVAARVAYDKAIELDPDDLTARDNRVQTLNNLGLQQEALQDLRAMLALRTTKLDTEVTEFRGKELSYRTLARLQLATQLEAMGRFPEAIAAFNDFVQADPGKFSYGWRGWFYFNRSEFDLARADLDKALTYDQDFWILHNLAGEVALYQHRYGDAVVSVTRSLELHPDYPASSYWTRALALRALNRLDEAEKDAETALTDDCCAFLNRKANTLMKLGYLQPVASKEQLAPALRDAAQACMLDEKCW
jgi:tetratricopeptide (TPR) repeat protein